MNGAKLGKAIKKVIETIPIILLNSAGDDKKKKKTELFSTVLNKPVKQQNFYYAIKKAISNEKEAEQEKSKSAISIEFAQTYPMRILVAEDNKINQKFIEFILKKLGYQSTIVENGIEVLKTMETTTFDLILMDVQMPEMDGFEATSIIKSKPGKSPIIVAMTANAMFDDKELCFINGMDDYLAKPMKIEEVMELLSKIYKQL